MTFTPGVPTLGTLLSTGANEIAANFTQLNTQFAVDHTAFNTGSGNGDGKHKKVTLPTVLGADPGTPATGGIIYNKTVTNAELFYKNNGGVVTQLTGLVGTAAAVGQITLSGGIIIKWGFANLAATGAAVTFAPAFTSVFQANFTPDGTTARSISLANLSNAGFNAYYTGGGTCLIHYIAIGV